MKTTLFRAGVAVSSTVGPPQPDGMPASIRIQMPRQPRRAMNYLRK
jgi:hypothetical protein